MIEGYFYFSMVSFLACTKLQFTDTTSIIIGDILLIIWLVIISILPIWIMIFLSMNRSNLNDNLFEQKFDSLYSGLNISGIGLFQLSIFLFRRLILATALILIDNSGGI